MNPGVLGGSGCTHPEADPQLGGGDPARVVNIENEKWREIGDGAPPDPRMASRRVVEHIRGRCMRCHQ